MFRFVLKLIQNEWDFGSVHKLLEVNSESQIVMYFTLSYGYQNFFCRKQENKVEIRLNEACAKPYG